MDLLTCSSVHYQTHGVNYTKVCGRVRGYHIGTLDGFLRRPSSENYVDGVSLTHGTTNNRQHIWTFAARVWCPAEVLRRLWGTTISATGQARRLGSST